MVKLKFRTIEKPATRTIDTRQSTFDTFFVMKNTLETRLGIFVALAVIAAVLILETVGGVDRFRRGYRFLGLFKNVQELKIGDRVKMAGVEVGRVQDITLTNDQVQVTMKIHATYRKAVKTDSVATVKYTSLFGQN